jgi:hypothetical protein
MTTKKNMGQGNRERRKIRDRPNLFVDRKKAEMGESNKRENWLKLNIKMWVLWLMYNDLNKRKR